jgi:inositol 1,4,5-triphosphate receptor type 1/inositol 1,4,5-triphosphate receptor type 3
MNVDDVKMYSNPLMKCFIKMNNQLEALTHEDSNTDNSELKLKLTICDIFEYFLDMRQEYLISNLLSFFKKEIMNSKLVEYKTNPQDAGKSVDEIRNIQIL